MITDLDDYQKQAMRTAPREFKAYGLPQSLQDAVMNYAEQQMGQRASQAEVDGYFASLFEPHLKNLDQMVWSLGLAGEAGEFADMMKKVHGHGHTFDKPKAAKELGDVLWYLSVLADSIGYKMSEIANMNIEKLKARYKHGFTIEESKHRKPE